MHSPCQCARDLSVAILALLAGNVACRHCERVFLNTLATHRQVQLLLRHPHPGPPLDSRVANHGMLTPACHQVRQQSQVAQKGAYKSC
eukprot:390614-Amphidinium_carterae.1